MSLVDSIPCYSSRPLPHVDAATHSRTWAHCLATRHDHDRTPTLQLATHDDHCLARALLTSSHDDHCHGRALRIETHDGHGRARPASADTQHVPTPHAIFLNSAPRRPLPRAAIFHSLLAVATATRGLDTGVHPLYARTRTTSTTAPGRCSSVFTAALPRTEASTLHATRPLPHVDAMHWYERRPRPRAESTLSCA